MTFFFEFIDSYQLMHRPFGRDKKSKLVAAVPVETVQESVLHFKERGGSLDMLVSSVADKIKNYSRAGGNNLELNQAMLEKGLSCSEEFYFVLSLLMKKALDDPGFHFEKERGCLSEHHPIWEAGPDGLWKLGGIHVPPWGVDESGDSIRESSVRTIMSGLHTFEAVVAADRRDPEEAEQRFFGIVNAFVDTEHYVTKDLFSNEDNWISYRLTQLIYEAWRIVSGRPDFLTLVGKNNISDGIRNASKFLPVKTGYALMAKFGNKYTRAFRYEAVEIGLSHAVIRMHICPGFEEQLGPFKKRGYKNAPEISMHTMEAIANEVYGLTSRPALMTAYMDLPISKDVLNQVPGTVSTRFQKEIAERVSSGIPADFYEFLFHWKRELTGWKRIFKPLPVILGCSSLPLLYHALESDSPPLAKAINAVLSLSPAVVAWFVHKIRKDRSRVEESDYIRVSQQATIEGLESRLQEYDVVFRRDYIQRIIVHGLNLLQLGEYTAAINEFETGLKHSPLAETRKGALAGYRAAIFPLKQKYLPEMPGASIKILVLSPEERIQNIDVEGLEKVVVFKPYDSVATAERVVRLAGELKKRGCSVVDVLTYFGGEGDAYIIEDFVTWKDNPTERAPNLLEVCEEGRLTGDLIRRTQEVAADIYAELLRIKKDCPELIEDVTRPTAELQATDYLEHLAHQGIGVHGSEQLLETGLYSYINDERVVGEFETVFRECADVFLRLARDMEPDLSFDFTWLNFVMEDREESTNPVLVDLERVRNYDFCLFAANAVAMSDVVSREPVRLEADIEISGRIYREKGEVVSGTDKYYLDFLCMIHNAVKSKGIVYGYSADVEKLLKYMPVAAFFKAFLLSGTFSAKARKHGQEGETALRLRSKRHGIKCLENARDEIPGVKRNFELSAEDKEKLDGLYAAFDDLLVNIKMHGRSDSHIHGGISTCVWAKYGNPVGASSSLSEMLEFAERTIDEKLMHLHGGIEHPCIVEHPRFTTYKVPFRMYKHVLDKVMKRHRFDFATLSFGLELEVEPDGGGGFRISMDGLDEKRLAHVFDYDDIMRNLPPELQAYEGNLEALLLSPEEIISHVDVLFLEAPIKLFMKDDGSCVISSIDDYVGLLEAKANLLAGLKREYGESKAYILAHLWRIAAEINNRLGDTVIEQPKEGVLSDFVSIIYHEGLRWEVNNSMLEKGLDDINNGMPASMLGSVVHYFETRNKATGGNRRMGVCLTSDAHHVDQLKLIGKQRLLELEPSLVSPHVLCNLDAYDH